MGLLITIYRISGDEWKVDNCTWCQCTDLGHVRCKTKECVLEECQLGEERKIIDPPKGLLPFSPLIIPVKLCK